MFSFFSFQKLVKFATDLSFDFNLVRGDFKSFKYQNCKKFHVLKFKNQNILSFQDFKILEYIKICLLFKNRQIIYLIFEVFLIQFKHDPMGSY